jgi:hypothetical protein
MRSTNNMPFVKLQSSKLKSSAFLGVSLSFAILFQAGCSTDRAASQNPGEPEKTSSAVAALHDVTLPEGTLLAVRTTSVLSTKTQESGETFTATLEQPLLYEGREMAAKGARVEGLIVKADKGGRVKGVASLTVRLTGLHADGQMIEISTNAVTHNARTTKGRDATEIAAGAGIGAVIGALAGGGKGAAIGAGAGGAAGTGVVLATRGDPAVIPSETVLNFELRAPVTIARR